MKIKVLFIAPYRAMSFLIEQCRLEVQDMIVDVKIANLDDATPFAKSAENLGYDVIISRGGTAKLIADVTNLPIIDIHVSGYDMLRALTLANTFPGKKAIVGFSNFTLGAKTITDILDIPIDVYTVERAEEVEPLILKLRQEDFSVIIGDVVTVRTADKYGLEGILIQSGREAIFDAFQRVRNVYDIFQKQQAEISLLKSIVEKTHLDLIVFNSKKEVVFQQWHSISLSAMDTDKLLTIMNQHRTVLLHTDSNEKIQAVPSKILVGKNEYMLFVFSKLRGSFSDSKIQVETVQQPPMLIQESESMTFCLARVEANLEKNNWVLIGEPGTGKERLARFIHFQKYEGRGLFAKASAADILSNFKEPDENIHTLFIYGTKQLTQENQLKLINLVEEKSNRNIILSLDEENQTMHSFLFDQHTTRIYIPPLRERIKDIRALTAYFIADFHQKKGTTPIKIKEEAVSLLEDYSWPGNVKELKALIQDAVMLEKRDVLDYNNIEQLMDKKNAKSKNINESFLQGTLEEIEKRIIDKILEEENGNQTRVAKRLGINRSTLWRKLKH